MRRDRPHAGRAGPVVLGILLIAFGLAFLVLQQLEVDFARFGWPLFVIVPGIALVIYGLYLAEGSGAVVGGTIITIVGLILLYQNSTGHWESWAYAWALAAPAGVGLGLILHGILRDQPSVVSGGLWPLGIGLAIFGVGFVFFEQVIGISDRQLPIPGWFVPAALVVVGAIFLWRGVSERRPRLRSQEPMPPLPPPPSERPSASPPEGNAHPQDSNEPHRGRRRRRRGSRP